VSHSLLYYEHELVGMVHSFQMFLYENKLSTTNIQYLHRLKRSKLWILACLFCTVLWRQEGRQINSQSICYRVHLHITKYIPYIPFRSLQLVDYLDNYQNNYLRIPRIQSYKSGCCSQHGFYFDFF